jgi:hypothetical protein
MTMQVTSTQLKEYEAIVSLCDKKRSALEKTKQEIAHELRSQWKTIESAKAVLLQPMTKELHSVFDNRKLFYKIIGFLSDTSLSLISRVQRAWNYYVMNCPSWPRRIQAAYPSGGYVSPITDAKTAKVFFCRLKTLESMNARAVKINEGYDQTLAYYKRALGIHIATVLPIEMTLIILAGIWPLFLIQHPRKEELMVDDEPEIHFSPTIVVINN